MQFMTNFLQRHLFNKYQRMRALIASTLRHFNPSTSKALGFNLLKFAFSRRELMLLNLVRKFLWTIIGIWLCGLLATANADTYQLTDGTPVSGDVVSFNDAGVIFHTSGDQYTDRIPWTKFSQDALKILAKNPKLDEFAAPFIETPPSPPPQLEVHLRPVFRLELPPKQSVISALFSSSLGIIILLLIYGTNVYAGFEVAIFRSRAPVLVAGLAALLPILGPIIFLSLPTQVEPGATEEDMQMETGAPPEAIAPPRASPARAPESPLATTESVQVAPPGWQQAVPALPEPQVFQRGQFTFNRRFFETKFPGFFGMIRHGADKDMVLIVKTPRAQYLVHRITRIAANDAHFDVTAGAARQEVMVPFGEIQEIQLKHKAT
jgi:hypothetical protein